MEHFLEYAGAFLSASPTLIVSIILLCLALKHRKHKNSRDSLVGFAIFLISAIYVGFQSNFWEEWGYVSTSILFILPIFFLLHSISVLSLKRNVALLWSLLIAIPFFITGIGYQTGRLTVSSWDIVLVIFVYIVFVVISSFKILLSVAYRVDHKNNAKRLKLKNEQK